MIRFGTIFIFFFMCSVAFSQSEEVVIQFPDVEAEFIGGVLSMQNYIKENIIYPEKALVKDKESKIYVLFTVEPDGSISDVKAQDGHHLLRKEAERLVANMPAWKPAELDGKKIKQRCQVPINFVIK